MLYHHHNTNIPYHVTCSRREEVRWIPKCCFQNHQWDQSRERRRVHPTRQLKRQLQRTFATYYASTSPERRSNVKKMKIPQRNPAILNHLSLSSRQDTWSHSRPPRNRLLHYFRIRRWHFPTLRWSERETKEYREVTELSYDCTGADWFISLATTQRTGTSSCQALEAMGTWGS